MENNEWISTKEKLPKINEEVDVKYIFPNGKEEIYEGGHAYLEHTCCMLATVSNFGNFGEGFGTYNGPCENGLTIDAPDFWRYSKP